MPPPWLGAVAVALTTGSALGLATRWASVPDRADPVLGASSRRVAWVQDRWRRSVGAAVVARAVGRWRADGVRRARVAQLPEFVDGVVRSARAGMSLPVALRDGAEVVGPPLLDDVVRVEREVALGVPWAEALRRWAWVAGGDDLELFTTACVLGAGMGRGTADALDGVARTLTDRRSVVAEARSSAAQARASALLLAALPVVVTVLLALVDPATLTVLLATPMGWVCLAAAMVLDAIGLWWMRRLIGAVA